ncbi:LIC11755 family lipoprotein [Leptospira koniambonensis]|uniref:LIC11755 family lipoprotein n=1 Tax=Leptospira koniambonensis TaxID=2484950 RepID=UPI003EBD2F09
MRTILLAFCLIIFFISASCKQDSGAELLWEDLEKSIQFQYNPNLAKDPKLISDLVHEDERACFISGEDPNFKIRICISEDGISEFAQVVSAWKEGTLIPEFSSTLSDDSEYKLGTYPFSGIKKKVEGSKFALIGDRKLKSLSTDALVWDRANINLKNHFKVLSIFIFSNGTSYLVLSPLGESEIYLGLFFKAPSLEKDIQNLIQSKNQNGLDTCVSSIPIITEIFGETNSSIGRWIEIYNPNTFPICEEGLEFNLLGNKVSLPITTGFISPYETRIYAEDSASLERISLSGIKWGDLKKVGKILLGRLDQYLEFNLPGTGYLFGETYYSWKGKSFSNCEAASKFCMDPGENRDSNIESESACDLNDFELEELNPNGLLHKGIFHSDWKYLDLIYNGSKICDPSSLRIAWGKNLFPIHISKRISSDEILNIGNLPFLLGNSSYSLSNFKSVTANDIVSLSNSSGKEKVLWDGIFRTSKGIPNRIVLQKTNGETVSICFKNGLAILHSNSADPAFLQSAIYSENPRTSPARKFCQRSEIESKAIFSEVSWMGSYQGPDPISKDRFLEFVSVTQNSPDSAFLEIIQGNGTAISILLPLEKEGLSLLSSGKSTCFPETEFWKDVSFSLPSSGTNILKIYDPYTGKLWDEFSYSSAGPGVNDTRNKIRKSAYSKIESGSRFWSVSSYAGRPYRDPSCPLTDAHPGILE